MSLALLLAGLTFSAQADAANFGVTPTALAFAPPIISGDITIANTDREPLRLSVRVYAWSQDSSGNETLIETDRIAYYPAIMTIAPGSAQRIRVEALDIGGTVEKTYRLVILEIPAFQKSRRGIAFRVKMSLPIFVRPIGQDATAPQLRAVENSRGALEVIVANSGNTHATPSTLSATGRDRNGRIIWNIKQSVGDVLALGALRVGLPLPRATCRRIGRVDLQWARSDGETQRTLAMSPGACQ